VSHAIGLFPRWQPEYAAHNIATFPVLISADNKRPAVKHYKKVGLPGSAQLAMKFENDNVFGFMVGDRTRLTILDVDTPDERVLTRALDCHGHSPIIVRTGSGKFHAYYRHNREHRLIRPWPDRPIDLLGAGFVVAPPSTTEKGAYQFIQGSLEDLDRLPVLRNLDLPKAEGAKQGARNKSLFDHCMRHANHVDDFDSLLDVARTFNDNCEPPLEDTEVTAVARNAWGYEQRGENRFGKHGAWFPLDEVKRMIDNQDAFFLLAFLRANQGPDATFMCANGLADKFGWTRKRLADGRRRLIELGYFKPVRQAGYRTAALHRWTKPRGGQN
jgi:hypothetical protein